jgi:hypothetical protein
MAERRRRRKASNRLPSPTRVCGGEEAYVVGHYGALCIRFPGIAGHRAPLRGGADDLRHVRHVLA